MDRMTRVLVLFVLSASVALAGPNNPGPMDPTEIWTSQDVTTVPITSTAYYPIGLDAKIDCKVLVEGLAWGSTVSFKQVYGWPAMTGTLYPVYNGVSTTTWTGGTNDLNQIVPITFPSGGERMYWSSWTNDSDGATITCSCNGH